MLEGALLGIGALIKRIQHSVGRGGWGGGWGAFFKEGAITLF